MVIHISNFQTICQVISNFQFPASLSVRAVRRLHTTSQRLHEGGGLTKAWAGGVFASPHKSSGGHTPPLS